jgi:hypothetical protein
VSDEGAAAAFESTVPDVHNDYKPDTKMDTAAIKHEITADDVKGSSEPFWHWPTEPVSADVQEEITLFAETVHLRKGGDEAKAKAERDMTAVYLKVRLNDTDPISYLLMEWYIFFIIALSFLNV